MNNKLILVRGPSGSGKSTFARKLAAQIHAPVFETDQYFINSKGEYVFDRNKLGPAHMWNQSRTKDALAQGKTVIVANTLTTMKEIQDYTKMADSLGIPVEVYRSKSRFENVPGVPPEAVDAMFARMVDYPGETIINK